MQKSKRQERKAARGAGASRPNRRAQERLNSAEAGYQSACKASRNAAAYTKPGSQKKW